MSYRREIPKFNLDIFVAWQELMRLHLSTIEDIGLYFLENEYVAPPRPMSMDQMVDMKNHNTMMIYIASSLSYIEFDEVKDYSTTYDTWKKLK